MRLLLDTHIFLWWLTDNRRLSATARAHISDEGSTVFVSAVSIWEIAIKGALGKLVLDKAVRNRLAKLPELCFFEDLPVTGAHAAHVWELPPHHQDPFDRLLIAQAALEGLTIVTADSAFDDYDVDLLPAT